MANSFIDNYKKSLWRKGLLKNEAQNLEKEKPAHRYWPCSVEIVL